MAAAAGPAAAAGEEEEAGESRKLFVGGIPAGAQEPELRAHFARFGEVRSVIVMRDRETGHGRGFGFVEFEDEAAAAAALDSKESDRHDAFFSCKVSFFLILNLSSAFKINRFAAAAAMFGRSVFLLVLRNRRL